MPSCSGKSGTQEYINTHIHVNLELVLMMHKINAYKGLGGTTFLLLVTRIASVKSKYLNSSEKEGMHLPLPVKI